MFHSGQWNEKQNMVKDSLSQQIESKTQRHYVNPVFDKDSNNFQFQPEDSKEDMTSGKHNIYHMNEFVKILVLNI